MKKQSLEVIEIGLLAAMREREVWRTVRDFEGGASDHD
jgi:hypothetical protein